MSEFSSYLKEYIALHNINVSTMVKYCNMDRETMYKYINGKLLPPSLELIQRMAEYMQLSPAEQGIFFENYHISKVGRYTYLRRKKAEQFLTEFPDSTVHLSMKNMSAIPAALSASVTAPDGYVSCLALNSSSALNGQVCRYYKTRWVLKIRVWPCSYSRNTVSLCSTWPLILKPISLWKSLIFFVWIRSILSRAVILLKIWTI